MSSPSKRKAKREHRESTPPPGQAGRVLDRLLLLEKVIPPGEVRQVLEDTGCLDARRCTLTFEIACWMVLAMGVLTDLPLRQVFKACRRLYPGEDTPHRSSLCRARQRLGVGPVRLLFERIARPLADALTPGSFYAGLRLMGIDGTTYTVPDSEANASAFGYTGRSRRGCLSAGAETQPGGTGHARRAGAGAAGYQGQGRLREVHGPWAVPPPEAGDAVAVGPRLPQL